MRYIIAFLIATVLTIGLFLFMHQLINTGIEELKGTDTPVIEMFQIGKQKAKQHKDRKRPEPPPPPETPPPPPEIEISQAIVNAPPIEINMPKISLNNIRSGPSIAGFSTGSMARDSSAIPLLLTQPVYPRKALMDGTQGYVRLQFTVTPAGTVKDVKVIESKPKRIFDRAAKKAILRSKFKPDVVDGVPIASMKIYTYDFIMGK